MPNLYLDLYGTYTDKKKVLADFPVELHHRIIVYPPLSGQEIANGLSKAKVFFFPSQYEGFGFAPVEAMACSCAAVITRTGFAVELCDKQEALLCDFEDIYAMEQAILYLLQDSNMCLRIAQGGWERVRALSWEVNTKKLADIYTKWLTDYHHPQPS